MSDSVHSRQARSFSHCRGRRPAPPTSRPTCHPRHSAPRHGDEPRRRARRSLHALQAPPLRRQKPEQLCRSGQGFCGHLSISMCYAVPVPVAVFTHARAAGRPAEVAHHLVVAVPDPPSLTDRRDSSLETAPIRSSRFYHSKGGNVKIQFRLQSKALWHGPPSSPPFRRRTPLRHQRESSRARAGAVMRLGSSLAGPLLRPRPRRGLLRTPASAGPSPSPRARMSQSPGG